MDLARLTPSRSAKEVVEPSTLRSDLGDLTSLSSRNCIFRPSFSSSSSLSKVSSLSPPNRQTGVSGICLPLDVPLETGRDTQDVPLDTGLDIDTFLDLVHPLSTSSSPSRLMTLEKRLCLTTLPHLLT